MISSSTPFLTAWQSKRIYKAGTLREDTCEIFEHMEIAEQVYEGGTLSKIIIRAESALPTTSKEGHAGKCKKNHAGHPIDWMTGDRDDWCMAMGPIRQSAKYSRNRSGISA